MARVFLSHSSRDIEAAARMKDWLEAQHFEVPFLDFDKHAGIPPGAEWEKVLYDEICRSQALLILQTPNWSASRWCFAEFTQARALGKPVFQVIEDDGGGAEPPIARDLQRLDLRCDRESGLAALRNQLIQIAEQDQGGFTWPPPGDPHRPPFPGLMMFEQEDAAVFFGRDGDWREVIERLNSRRVHPGGPRLLVLQGASGAGKSSLLRAGVLPRLRRAGKQWLLLPPMRPQTKPLEALAKSWAIALERTGEWRGLHKQLQEGTRSASPTALLQSWAVDLQMAVSAPDAQILLSIDQGEELFTVAEAEEKQGFLQVLGAALSQPLPLQAVMTIRADSMGELQQVVALVNRFETLPLGPLPMERYREIIEGPARVAGLKVEEAFVAQAVRDTETEDALPLLAVALHDLHERFGRDGRLSLSDYQALGDVAAGLSPLENAVRRIADGALLEMKDSETELRALRDAFIPAMVRLTEQGTFSRAVARWDDLPLAAFPLLNRLVETRLLVSGKAEGTLEVAHEALLRTWPTLKDWLDESRQELEQRSRVLRLFEDLKSSLLPVRLVALRSLEMLAETDPQALLEADKALLALLKGEQFQGETDNEHVGRALEIQTTAARRLQLQELRQGFSWADETRFLRVPTATVRAEAGAVSTSLVTLRLWPPPRHPILSAPLGGTAAEKMKGAWFEELAPGVSLTMVMIPAGSFLMGSPQQEPERVKTEGPHHEVTLEWFFLSQTPITQAQWRVVTGWPVAQKELDPDPSEFKGADRPVEQVSWWDAMEFCSRLYHRSGRRYILPSEAQWEYACRAGSTTPFHLGDTITPELANYDATFAYNEGPKRTCRRQSSEVGRYPANAWGLQDLHGNVMEWCLDQWHQNYKGAPDDGSAWLYPGETGRRRLLRGGSWRSRPGYCRSASRFNGRPGDDGGDIGFRVCCLPQDQTFGQ